MNDPYDFREGHARTCALWRSAVDYDCSCGVTAFRVWWFRLRAVKEG